MTTSEQAFPAPFGPYTLLRKIASGGMAELFLGETTGPGGFAKPVVVKMIHRHLSEDPRFVSMFTDEARIVAGFVHGNIVPIFDFGVIDGRTYLVMEFIDGLDLETLTETCRINGIPLPPEVAVRIGAGAAAGLHYAHCATGPEGRDLAVVHRDVSPHNILVSRAGEVKLCDFGIAFSEANKGGTDAGVIKGKLHYLSPEQAAGEPVDHRSDIFSLGVTLYEMLAGHHPVPSGSGVTVLKCLSEKRSYITLADAAPWLNPEVSRIIDKAIAFNVEDRYRDAEEMRGDLTRVLHNDYGNFSPASLAGLVVRVQDRVLNNDSSNLDDAVRAQLASFASEVRTRTREVSFQTKRKKTWTLGLIGAAAFALVAFGLFFLLGGWDPTPKGPTLSTDEPPLTNEDAGAGKPGLPMITDAGTAAVDAGFKRKPHQGFEDAGQTNTGPAEPKDKKPKSPPATRPKGTGTLDANAAPWAEVKIDGKSFGTTPLLGLKLPAGRHKAVFKNPDLGVVEKRTFTIRPGKSTRLVVEME